MKTKQYIYVIGASVISSILTVWAFSLYLNKNYENQPENHQVPQANVKQVNFTSEFNANQININFTEAAEKSLNAVVHVKTEIIEQNPYYMDPFYSFFYGGRIPQRVFQSSGSGVIISPNGFIVTNNHVIKNANKIEVTLNNKQTYDAQLIGTDPTTDLAVLKIDATNLPVLTYGNSDESKVGEWVLAVGNPFNLTSTVTAGIISAKGRSINILPQDPHTGIAPIESFIQTDAAVNPGNSGGALVNLNGELIGINSAIKSNTGSYTGYSFAIPSNIVKKVVSDIIEFGEVQRAFLGVSINDITDEIAQKLNLSTLKGVFVAGVNNNGAAAEAGIEPGDIITKVGNIEVNKTSELLEHIGQFRPGDKVNLTVIRDGKEKIIPVVLKNYKGSTELVNKTEIAQWQALGADFTEINEKEKKALGIEYGLKIKQLKSGKLAYAGIQPGFIITKINNEPIKDFSDLIDKINKSNGGVLIEGVYPNGKRAYYGIGL
jgi:Do/DeqQ family serine protease